MRSTAEMTEEAIDWLRTNLENVPSVVFISGGKDSIVTEALAKKAGLLYRLNSTLTGIDPPEVIRFIRVNYPECDFVRPRQSFWHLLTTANPPGGTGRGIKWCCTKIKEDPSNVIPIRHRIMGIRAEESPARAKYGRLCERKGRVYYYPIFDWLEWHIWEFIEEHKLPYPALYDEGFSRIGCVICPNHHNRHEQYREKWPKYFECFEKYVRIWWDKRVGQGKDMWFDSVEEFIENWYAGKFYYYKPKKERSKSMIEEFFKLAERFVAAFESIAKNLCCIVDELREDRKDSFPDAVQSALPDSAAEKDSDPDPEPESTPDSESTPELESTEVVYPESDTAEYKDVWIQMANEREITIPKGTRLKTIAKWVREYDKIHPASTGTEQKTTDNGPFDTDAPVPTSNEMLEPLQALYKKVSEGTKGSADDKQNAGFTAIHDILDKHAGGVQGVMEVSEENRAAVKKAAEEALGA